MTASAKINPYQELYFESLIDSLCSLALGAAVVIATAVVIVGALVCFRGSGFHVQPNLQNQSKAAHIHNTQ